VGAEPHATARARMRKAPEKQDGGALAPWKPPTDFCIAPPWPKEPPGPPPITKPVSHSGRIRHTNTMCDNRHTGSTSPTKLAALGEEGGAARGMSEDMLLVKNAADKQQGELTILLKAGHNPNVLVKVPWQDFETTPLFEASVNGYKRIVRVLIEHGAKVDTIVGPGFSPVYNAALNGHFDSVRLLVDAGANVATVTDSGFSPLFVACQGGHTDCVVSILGSPTMTKAAADIAPSKLNGATALYIAAQNGHADCVEQLLHAGVNVDPQMADGSTPLHIAMFLAERDADRPHVEITAMLLENGGSLDLKNQQGHSVRELAKDDYSLVEMVKNEEEMRERQKQTGQRGWW